MKPSEGLEFEEDGNVSNVRILPQVASYVRRDKIAPYPRGSGILTDSQSPSGAIDVSLIG